MDLPRSLSLGSPLVIAVVAVLVGSSALFVSLEATGVVDLVPGFGPDADGDDGGPPGLGPWTEQARLIATDATQGDVAGSSVALLDGTAVLGAPRSDGVATQDSGAAYVFASDDPATGPWQEEAKLTSDEAAHFDLFGWDVALGGGTLAVGAPGDDRAGRDAGAVHLFGRRMGDLGSDVTSPWERRAVLVADDARPRDLLGIAVAVAPDGDTVVVGATNRTVDGNETGAAYVFDRVGGTWTRTDRLDPPDERDDALFGTAVAVDGNLLVVGADQGGPNGTGAAYVYRRDAHGAPWALEARLLPPGDGGDHRFGTSVAVLGDALAVGDPGTDQAGPFTGSVHVYAHRTGGDRDRPWRLQETLAASDARENGFFGASVALDGDTLLVGSAQGAYAFVRPAEGDGWMLEGRLPEVGDDVALDGDVALIGVARADDRGARSGAGVLYVRDA